jgi:uncharacterized membrane-anchored protein YhcB (DUF1043 family)
MKRQYLKPKGESLIEVIITTALVSTIVIILTMFMMRVLDNVVYITDRSNLTQETSLTLDNINRNIRLAKSLLSDYQNGATHYTTSATTLILSLPSLDSNNNIISNQYDTIIYSQDQSDTSHLNEVVVPASGSIRPERHGAVFTSLGEITFTRTITSKSIKIDTKITGQQTINNNLSRFSLESTSSLRNL